MLYRHGLRVSELCSIKLEQLNLDGASLFVKRSKNGIDGMHPIAGDELRLIRRYLRERKSDLPWLFVSERGTPFARSSVNKILEQCGQANHPTPPKPPHATSWLRFLHDQQRP